MLDRGNEAVGAGFLVGPDRIATCAHVVAAALGTDPYAAAAPTGELRLDFPLFVEPAGRPATITAVVDRWEPIGDDGSGDIAVLRLHGTVPAGARMPPLRRVERLWDHPFRLLGFPAGFADGVWATGRIRGEQGTRWFQLQGAVGDQPIVEGFSGSPVWDDETGAVVGMAVATDASGATTTAYLIPIDQVLGVDPELLPCPYRGLEPFDEEHAPYFFGRDADIAHLVDAVARRPLVAVAGPSGAGKSSLVRAGLLPLLRAAGNTVTELRPVRGEPALATVAAAVPGGAVGDDIEKLAADAARARTVLVLDQFEELAAAEPERAQELLRVLGELVNAAPPAGAGASLRVVLTLRSATLDDVNARDLAGLLGAGTVLLPPMDRNQLRDAIVAPAERAPGLSFEPGLVDRILDDAAAEPGQLPLVESLLTELWERRDGGYLTLAAYAQAGGVAGVVATHAENVVARYTDPADEPRLRRLFTSLAGPDRDGRFVRRAMPLHELPADLLPLVRALAAGRLMVVERSPNGIDHVQLAHQALIAHWPRLQDWLAEDRDFLSWRDQLDQQRKRWEVGGRDDGSLLRGTALDAAQEWLPQRSADVSTPGLEYVRQSRSRQRRDVRRWRIITAVLAVLGLAAATLAAVTISSRNQISDQLRRANSEIVAQDALARAGTDPVTATQLALTAWKLNPANAAARTALVKQYLATRSVAAIYPAVTSSQILAFASSADGFRIMLIDGAGLVVLSGLPMGTVDRWSVPDVPANFIVGSLSSDGRRILMVDKDGVTWAWDTVTRSGPRRLPLVVDKDAEPQTAAFNDDQTKIVWLRQVAPDVHAVEIRDVDTGAVVPHRIAPITGAGLSNMDLAGADDKLVVQRWSSANPDGTFDVLSLADGSVLHTFPPGSVAAGQHSVVTCENDGTNALAVVRDIDKDTETLRFPLISACSGTKPLIVSRDHEYLVELGPMGDNSDYGIARVTRLSDGRPYEVIVPADAQAPLNKAGWGPTLFALPGGDAGITLLLARGSSILRMRGELAPPAGKRPLWITDDQRFFLGAIGSGYRMFDPGFRETAQLPDAAGGGAIRQDRVTDALSVLTRGPAGWSTAEYTVPALDRRYQHDLPESQAATAAAARVLPDRIASFANGVVTAWDRTTGRPIREPLHLATTPTAQEWYRTRAIIDFRPGHPDEVAVLGPDSTIELWDTAAGRRITTLPATPQRLPVTFAFDPTGDRLASITVGGSIDIWDVDSQTVVGQPFPAPGTTLIVGFTADGSLVTRRTDGTSGMEFWDVASGRKSGEVAIAQQYFLNAVSPDGRSLNLGGVGPLPFSMSLTGQQWFDRLCSFSDRPLTDAERALLPAGTDVDRPCAE
ncbi:trypsin-like peptidase domain-containing protein [Pseudonocardia sp. GCM10023141]|uniref:nSTAND1 domain-containing NTPase n=1 Tax=Pseudonocardia sp. GCM10023141 TaxID=3252653 RepID=UPI00361900D0